MWSKLDDELLTHPKVDIAGQRLGDNGPAVAIGLYAVCLMWSNKNLTDGFLPHATVNRYFAYYVKKPAAVVDALVHAGFLEKVEGGYQVHDFDEHNPCASAIKKKRKEDRLRKQQERAAERNGQR